MRRWIGLPLLLSFATAFSLVLGFVPRAVADELPEEPPLLELMEGEDPAQQRAFEIAAAIREEVDEDADEATIARAAFDTLQDVEDANELLPLILDEFEIEHVEVSLEDGSHAWSMVMPDEAWYHLDVEEHMLLVSDQSMRELGEEYAKWMVVVEEGSEGEAPELPVAPEDYVFEDAALPAETSEPTEDSDEEIAKEEGDASQETEATDVDADEEEQSLLDPQTASGSYGVDRDTASYNYLNPYTSPECEWFAWGRANEKLGVSLPVWGEPATWDESAASAGFIVSTTPRANSIMVENFSDPTYGDGQVRFVERMDGDYAYITESEFLSNSNPNAKYYHEDRINTRTRVADSWPSHTMSSDIKYIYLGLPISSVSVSYSNQTYTGSPIRPKVVVTDGSMTLVEGKHYTVSYRDNINVGTGTIVITGKGSYSGTKTVTFEIYAASSSRLTVDSISSKTYTGSPIKPKPTVKDGTTALVEGTDYTLSYKNNTAKGTATITITFIGNYTGTLTVTFKIVAAPASRVTVASIPDQTYTGSAVKPKPTVKDGTRVLKEGTDYTLSYKNNTAKGTATVTITFIGNYTGTQTCTFKITVLITLATSNSKVSVSSVGSQMYCGSAIRPKPTVKYGTTVLREGTDYTLSYKNNTKAGTATVTITGKGKYTGTRTITFLIIAIPSSKVSVSSVSSRTCTYSPICPKPTVRWGSVVLKEGTDYTLSYENNVNAGTAVIIIVLRGNYSGTIRITFKIVASNTFRLIADGTYYLETATQKGMVLEAYNDTESWALLRVARANGSKNQQWRVFWNTDTGAYNFQNVGTGKFLVLGHGGADDGSRPVSLNQTPQLYEGAWRVTDVGDGFGIYLKNLAPSPMITVGPSSGNTSKTGIGLEAFGDTLDEPGTLQRFYFHPLSDEDALRANWIFSDVNSSTAHHDDIIWLYNAGITKGYGSGSNRTFQPYENVARADMAAFLYRLAGSPSFTPSAAQKRYFSDVDSSTPHAKEIWWLAAQGISKGWTERDGSHTFRPYDSVARADMAAFLYRMAGSPAYTPSAAQRRYFSDVNSSTPHANEIWWLASVGVSKGWTSGSTHTFQPYSNVARCDMAAFLRRMSEGGMVRQTK